MISFEEHEPSIAAIQMTRNSNGERVLGSKNLSWTAIYRTQTPRSKTIDQGIAIKRVFKSDRSDACFFDAQGIWHVRVGTSIKEHIEFIPAKTLDKVVVFENRGAHLDTVVQNSLEDSDRPSAPEYREDYRTEYSTSWPQRIHRTTSALSLYGQDLPPAVYSHDFDLKFVKPGTYDLPGVNVICPYNKSIFGKSAQQKVMVTP